MLQVYCNSWAHAEQYDIDLTNLKTGLYKDSFYKIIPECL